MQIRIAHKEMSWMIDVEAPTKGYDGAFLQRCFFLALRDFRKKEHDDDMEIIRLKVNLARIYDEYPECSDLKNILEK